MPVGKKEVRIGNNIFLNGKIIEVDHAIVSDLQFIEDGIKMKCLDSMIFEPIPISSNILEASKWLVEHKEKNTCYSYDGFKIWVVDNEGINQFYHLNSETLTFFDYVHQIQNYYYAISEGEELEIKFP
jgi:hypothetical protein